MSKKLSVYTGESGGYSPAPYSKEMKLATIDVSSEADLEKWGNVLHLSRSELLAAINDFGPVVRDIRIGLLHRSSDRAA
jgi:hypothetical protein